MSYAELHAFERENYEHMMLLEAQMEIALLDYRSLYPSFIAAKARAYTACRAERRVRHRTTATLLLVLCRDHLPRDLLRWLLESYVLPI